MTRKLFWDDPYQTSCNATVTSIEGRKVKLNQTGFYAFSGGQESDSGTIGGITVVEASKQGDKESIIDIEYTLENEPHFSVGDVVEVVIDPIKREKLRRLHSAAHIVYYVTIEILGKVPVVGSNIGVDKARMDFGFGGNLVEKLPLIEARTNNIINQNITIQRYVDSEKQDLWWWQCGDWKMPCGGTHARTTGEIGPLRLTRVNKGKGKERIEMFLSA